MRRVLIIVMLGIILYSTFMSLISTWPDPDNYKMLLDTVHGSVSEGNFTYWSFGQKGPLIIELTSVTGDADLFVGETLRPSYEADKNNFSSETCGIDLVFIPKEFPRPFVIGVYGHWPYNVSHFSMKVFADLERHNSDYHSEAAPDETYMASNIRMVESMRISIKDKPSMRTEVTARKEDEKEKTKILRIYKILDTVSGMLV